MASIRTQTETSGKSCFWSIFSHIGHILSASNMYKYVQICTCTYLSILHPYLCGQYAPNMGQNKWACIGPYCKIQKISIWVDMHQYVQIWEREIGDAGLHAAKMSTAVTAAAAASDEFAMSIGEISRQAATSAELARKATITASDADATISALTDSATQVSSRPSARRSTSRC